MTEETYRTDLFRDKLDKFGIEYMEQDTQFVLCTRVGTAEGGCKFVEHRKTGYTRFDAEGVDEAQAVAMTLLVSKVGGDQE